MKNTNTIFGILLGLSVIAIIILTLFLINCRNSNGNTYSNLYDLSTKNEQCWCVSQDGQRGQQCKSPNDCSGIETCVCPPPPGKNCYCLSEEGQRGPPCKSSRECSGIEMCVCPPPPPDPHKCWCIDNDRGNQGNPCKNEGDCDVYETCRFPSGKICPSPSPPSP